MILTLSLAHEKAHCVWEKCNTLSRECTPQMCDSLLCERVVTYAGICHILSPLHTHVHHTHTHIYIQFDTTLYSLVRPSLFN